MRSSSYIKKIFVNFSIFLLFLILFILFVVWCIVKFDMVAFQKVFLQRDGFTTLDFGTVYNSRFGPWSQTTVLEFIQFQKTNNPLLIFDMDIIQQKATENEAIQLLTTGMWPWSPVTQQIYLDTIIRDTHRQVNPLDSMNKDRTIYCEGVIRDMLAFKAPEGQFLLYGLLVRNRHENAAQESGEGTYGEESGLISQKQDLIRCNGAKGMQRIAWSGYDGITGVHVKNTENLNYVDLPEIIPGFSFLSAPCNPCDALSDDPLKKYRCPFTINKSNGNGGYYTGVQSVSDIWRVLWGFGNYFKSTSPQVPAEFAAFRVNN